MKRVSAPKRYFFVHLAIFAGLCGVFAAAGVSSYQDYLRSGSAWSLQAGLDPQERLDGPAPDAGAASGVNVLALSGMGTK